MKKISAVCLTYGRAGKQPELLEECLYWFAAQTYPNKELILFNDCPGESIIINHPEIKVFNFPSKIPSLGEKYDKAISMSSGDIIMSWEDDDISLPNRMSQAAKVLEHWDYFNPQRSWYEADGKLYSDHKHGVCHNASAFTRKAWEKVGGYGAYTGDQDAVMDRKLKSQVKYHPGVYLIEDWTYVYRWSVSHMHLSGHKDMHKAYTNYNFSGEGNIFISPKMNKNYEEIIKNLLLLPENKK